jgi:hypothetical protein
MVDIATHKKLHRDGNGRSQRVPFPGPNVLDVKYMSEDNPDLADDFFMCLPTSMIGFNMDKKEWGKYFGIVFEADAYPSKSIWTYTTCGM